MATYEIDKVKSDKDIEFLIDKALCLEDYPNPDNIDLVDLKEYDRQTRQVFLWVSELFTMDEWKFFEAFFQKQLSRRTQVAICRSNSHFGLTDEDFEDSY